MGKVERSKKRKLTATLLNGMALTLLGVSLAAAFSNWALASTELPWIVVTVLAVVVVIHFVARAALRGMEE